jgi:catechol 2,3-dioxygenase-like lactoylglutathione lyase family enzyme
MTITAMHHAALHVDDLDAALAFWTDVIGATLIQRADDVQGADADRITGYSNVSAAVAMVEIGASHLEIVTYRSPRLARSGSASRALADRGWSHVCLLTDDIDAECARLAAAGCTIHSTPADIGDGPACYLDDPWGNMLELWQYEPGGDGPSATRS